MIIIMLLILIESFNECFVNIEVSFYKVKVEGAISGDVISTYMNLYEILHPP